MIRIWLFLLQYKIFEIFFFILIENVYFQTVNERGDDPDARPMLYDPLQGSRTSKSRQYLATVIGMYHSYQWISFSFVLMASHKFNSNVKRIYSINPKWMWAIFYSKRLNCLCVVKIDQGHKYWLSILLLSDSIFIPHTINQIEMQKNKKFAYLMYYFKW